jgi:hypothetical protein
MARTHGLPPHLERARLAELEAKAKSSDRGYFYCPDHEPGCFTLAQHSEHESQLARAKDPETRPEDVERMARRLSWFPNAGVAAALLERDDLTDRSLGALAHIVADHSTEYYRSRKGDTVVLDFLMRPSLPKAALKEFAARARNCTGEAVLAFLAQERADDLLSVTLLVSLRRSTDLKDVREAFSTAPRYVAVSLAMIDLQPDWTGLTLLKAARTAVANFARDPDQGVETLESLAQGWSGDVKELIATVNAIII